MSLKRDIKIKIGRVAVQKKIVVYMAVGADAFEFPKKWSENRTEVANWAGLTEGALYRAIKQQSIDKTKNCKYVRVQIEVQTKTKKSEHSL